MCLQYKSFENTVGKGEIACKEQFLLFLQCFFFYLFGELSAFFDKFEIVLCKVFQFGRVLNLSFGKGLSNDTKTKVCFKGDERWMRNGNT